ncbi:hypothetical protein S83_016758 [Arachis hypogaea]
MYQLNARTQSDNGFTVVEVTCEVGSKTIKSYYGTTKINEKYSITVNDFDYVKYGSTVCQAKLHAPPKDSPCNIPTLLNDGTHLFFKSEDKYEVVLKAKPFAYVSKKPYEEFTYSRLEQYLASGDLMRKELLRHSSLLFDHFERAVWEVTCEVGSKTIKAHYGTTTINGKYNITVKDFDYVKYGSAVCKAKPHAPPKDSPCNIPTLLNDGTYLFFQVRGQV